MGITTNCFEIVQFSFQSSASLTQQTECMQALGRWVQTQPGYVARQCYRDPQSNRWTDVVEWSNQADALAAMQRSQNEASLAGAMALLDPHSIHVGHFERLL
jgi:hypothetical protein